MLIFTFLLLAMLLVSYCLFKKGKKVVPVIVTGVLAAVLVCSFKTLFLFAHRVVPYDFASNYLYLVFRQSLLPVIVLYGVFFCFSKDTLEYKAEAFFPLELSFYAVFLPHIVVSTSEGLYSGFSLFVKPLLFACMLIQLGILVRWAFNCLKNHKIVMMILLLLAAVVYACIPAVFETMALLKWNEVVLIIGCIVYCVIPVLLISLTALKKIAL